MAERSSGQPPGSPSAERFPLELPLEAIWSEQDAGYCEPAQALQAGSHGGVLLMKKAPPLGAELALSNPLSGESLVARVVSVQFAGAAAGSEVAVQFHSSSETFWGPSFRLKKATAELAELERAIRVGDVNPRVLREFRDAVDHIRKTAWVVQEWGERKAQGRETETVLGLLTLERIRRATQLTNDLAADLQSKDIPPQTAGLFELFRAVEQLHRVLTTLCAPHGA